uniref:Amino acid:DNA transferase domain-containing protein n=1 Tax=viral metagenome TaxID=1070528 RepID=A0A6C0EV44_9ZZZZ
MNETFNKTFEEVLSHSRNKKLMKSLLRNITLSDYDISEQEILIKVYKDFNVKGCGKLSKYDIFAALCRRYNIFMTKVYIVGNGPKRAIKLLKMKTNSHNINGIKLRYVEIDELIKELDKRINEKNRIYKNFDGDQLESFICNWQKNVLFDSVIEYYQKRATN